MDEISFTGTDYKQAGYLTTDANGRIQVAQSAPIASNAEYDGIVTKYLNERDDPTVNPVKLYLPSNVAPGSFNHTTDFCYVACNGTTQKFILECKFIGYQGSTSFVQTNVANIFNSAEIYNNTSQAHPNQVQNSVEKQHIINHFISDYNHYNYQY